MPDSTFIAETILVELDATDMTVLTDSDVSDYSIRHHLERRMAAFGYFIPIHSSDEGWPVYEELQRPSIYVWFGESANRGVELGSEGSQYIVSVQIFGRNDAERTRLADLIKKVFVRTIPIYNYVTGKEIDPDPTGEYFITDNVGWTKIPHT